VQAPQMEAIEVSVPRACGDEPLGDNRSRNALAVFPAHAGMNRCRIILVRRMDMCSPRMRG